MQIAAANETYRRARAWVAPYYDELGNCFIVGGERYSAVAPKNPTKEYSRISEDAPVVLTDSYQRMIQHGDTFDLDDPAQKIIVDMAIDNGVLARNKASVNPSSSHIFYVKDAVAEAKAKSTKADRVYEALGLAKKMSAKDKMAFAFFCNQPARTMNEEMIDAYVKDLCLTNPDRLIDAMGNADWKIRSFLHRAVHYSLVTVEGGLHKIGKDVIGIDEDAAVHFLKDAGNKELVGQLSDRIKQQQAEEAGVPQ